MFHTVLCRTECWKHSPLFSRVAKQKGLTFLIWLEQPSGSFPPPPNTQQHTLHSCICPHPFTLLWPIVWPRPFKSIQGAPKTWMISAFSKSTECVFVCMTYKPYHKIASMIVWQINWSSRWRRGWSSSSGTTSWMCAEVKAVAASSFSDCSPLQG